MISKDNEHPIKKAVMIIYWRTQQITGIFTMMMMALALTLQVNLYIEWRFSNTYIGIIITIIVLASTILFAGYIWDKRGRMWHEQMVVSVERNPFNVHKMAPKEVVMYQIFHIPILNFISEATGDDELKHKLKSTAIDLKAWSEDQMAKDHNLRASVDELMKQHF